MYLAELVGARGFRRSVAVKVLLAGSEEQEMFLSRVRDEARLLGLLHDEHILRVLELVRIGERDGVVMEYVEGVDLSALIAAGDRPPARALAELGAAIAGALHAAHTAKHPSSGEPLNVVHRDVKPANVMLSHRGSVKLLDFGIAQARFAARESRTGQFVLGTLNYMAPEYIITGEVSPAADVYGLALTLWEAAVGEVFGQPKLKQESHARRVEERLLRLASTHAELTPILRPMLSWDPQGRPSANEVERQLVGAADRFAGTGVRSWAAAHVPPALQQVRTSARDAAGLAGQTITIADESPDSVIAPALQVAEAPTPTPTPTLMPAATRTAAPAPAPAAKTPAAPPPEEHTLFNVERPAFLNDPPRPSPTPAPARPPRPAARKPAATSALMVVAQGLLAGAFVGLALVAAIGVYLLFNRGGP